MERKVYISYILLIIITIMFLFPIIWMVMQSLKTPLDVVSFPPKFIFKPTLKNYINVLQRPQLFKSFLDSFIIAACSVLISIIVGVPAAYSFSRFNFKFKDDLSFFILSTRMMPFVVVLIPFIRVFSKLGLTDSYIGLIATHILLHLALVVLVMKSFFASIPEEIEEAALIDGCSWLMVIRKVTLPMAAPGIATTAILSFIFSWNDLMFGYALTSSKIRPIPVRFSTEFIGYLQIEWGAISAAGILAVLPIIVVMLLVEKNLVKGFTFGLLDKS